MSEGKKDNARVIVNFIAMYDWYNTYNKMSVYTVNLGQPLKIIKMNN